MCSILCLSVNIYNGGGVKIEADLPDIDRFGLHARRSMGMKLVSIVNGL